MPEIWLETSKNSFWQKPDFVKINEFSLLKLKKCKNRKIDTFTFLAISLAIFELQRRTIPHFDHLNNSFSPFEKHFCSNVHRFWAIQPKISSISFCSHFSSNWAYLVGFIWHLWASGTLFRMFLASWGLVSPIIWCFGLLFSLEPLECSWVLTGKIGVTSKIHRLQ